MAGAFVMAVPDPVLLLAMGGAAARIHIEHNASPRAAVMNPVDPRFDGSQQFFDNESISRIAADQTMVAEDPDIAGLADRNHRRFRNFIGICQALIGIRQQFGEFIGREAGQAQIEIVALQLRELECQKLQVSACVQSELVVRKYIGAFLFLGPIVCHHHGNVGQAELLCRKDPAVASLLEI